MSHLSGIYNHDQVDKELYKKALDERFQNLNSVKINNLLIYTTGNIWETDDFIVALDGNLLDKYEELKSHVFSLLKKEKFPEDCEGDFRGVIYEKKNENLSVFTDMSGSKKMYYSKKEKSMAFSSHISPLTTLPWIKCELNIDKVKKHLVSPFLSFSGGETFIKNILRMEQAEIIRFDESLEHRTYWNLNPQKKIDISDDEASRRMRNLLLEAAKKVNQSSNDLKLYFSGGSDSALMAGIMNDVTEDLDTLTYSNEEDLGEFENARRVVKELDSNHEEINIDYELLDKDDIWRYEVPALAPTLHLPFHEIDRHIDSRELMQGAYSSIIFPDLRNISRVDRLSFLNQVMKKLPYSKSLSYWIQRFLPEKIGKGMEILMSPYKSSIMVSDRSLHTPIASEIYQFDNQEIKRDLEKSIEEKRNLEDLNYSETFSYLIYKEREARAVIDVFNDAYTFDIFTHPSILEFSLSLPAKQRCKTNLQKKLISKYYRRLGKKANTTLINDSRGRFEHDQVTSMVRKKLEKNLYSDKDRFKEEIESLGKRPFMNEEKTKKYLGDEQKIMDENIVVDALNLYNLEIWIKTFIERDEPWKKPA